MSIMVVNKTSERIEKDVNSLVNFLKNYTGERSTESIINNYRECLIMNEVSYSNQYNEVMESVEKINYNSLGYKKYDNNCELLKSMQCLRYNIELEKISLREQTALNWLDKTIASLQSYIISNLEDYKNASWC